MTIDNCHLYNIYKEKFVEPWGLFRAKSRFKFDLLASPRGTLDPVDFAPQTSYTLDNPHLSFITYKLQTTRPLTVWTASSITINAPDGLYLVGKPLIHYKHKKSNCRPFGLAFWAVCSSPIVLLKNQKKYYFCIYFVFVSQENTTSIMMVEGRRK